jgi:hypothetical protein
MYKALTLLIGIFSTANLMAEPALPLTPKTCKDITQVAEIWINGVTPVQTNIGTDKCANSFSGKILRILSRKPDKKEFLVKYKFESKKAGTYKFYAALIHQGTSYASPVKYRFDKEDWQKIIPVKGKRISWGVSTAINWESLGIKKLSAGLHTVEFRFNKKARNGNWSFMCDGIIGLRQDAKKKIKIDRITVNSKPQPGKPVSVKVIVSGDSQSTTAVLSLGKQTISSLPVFLQNGSNKFSLPLPKYLGANNYQLTLHSISDSKQIYGQCILTIPVAPSVTIPGVLKDTQVQGNRYTIAFAFPLKDDAIICCFLSINQKVYAVEVIRAKKGQSRLTGKFSKQFVKTAAGRTVKLVFYACPGIKSNKLSLACKFPGSSQPLPKPINYGIFVDRYGLSHPWYMNHRYQYIFDGKIYFPVGGMWCPSTLISRSVNPAIIKKHIEHDQKTLDNILKFGLNDVYLNLSHVAPLWVRQYFIDMLERKGINYGYQLNGGGKHKIPAFFITRDKPKGGKRWQGLIHGQYSDGKITARLPKSYKALGFLIIPDTATPDKCFMVSFKDSEGKDTRHHIIDLETAQNYQKIRPVSVKVNLPLANGSKVIIVPLLESKMHHSNLWDPAQRKRIMERLSWIKDIQWGPRLRCFIDPLCNETNMVNSTENLRQYTSDINNDFATWLKNKYKNISRLRDNWKTKVSSFAEAARLIPLRINDKLWLCDPASGRIYKSSLKNSMAWIDYNDMIRETYAAYTDDFAIKIKSLVNIPVINKSVGVHGAKTHISRKYLGWDGTGYEIYLNQGFPPEGGGGASRAEAEASSHTMWKVGTELGHSAQVGNGGAKFFKTESDIQKIARELALSGVKGFYFFGFDLKPGRMWGNHNYHDFPTGLKWVKRIKAEYADGTKPASPSSFIYPGGYGWWWWTTRWESIYDYEQNTIPQSVRINGNEWGSNTDILPDEFKRVIINCPNPPFSIKHARKINQLIKANKNVVYLGFRNDLGIIKELDKYFTNNKVNFNDGSVAQVLKRLPDTRILAEKDGKPWAVRNRNLLIISRNPVKENKSNADTGFKYLKPKWIN